MKARLAILALFLLFVHNVSIGQKIEKIIISRNDNHKIYDDYEHNDSTTIFYLRIIPKIKPKGTLVIIPAGGDLVEDMMKQITLYRLAVDSGLLVIIPSINGGSNKLDDQCEFLDTILRQVVEQYHVPFDKFFLGGLSGGGMISLRYAEKANHLPFLEPI
ncbi:MAG TPA: hypothetical protein VKR32_07915 [Puia sp.]|nr:hypothetical protein [Puia sp.]